MRAARLALGIGPPDGPEHHHGLIARHPQHVAQGQRAGIDEQRAVYDFLKRKLG